MTGAIILCVEVQILQNVINYIVKALKLRIPKIKIVATNDVESSKLIIPNKYGGQPVVIFTQKDADIIVTYNKNPRSFSQDEKDIDKLIFDVSEYLSGRSVYLDILKIDGSSEGQDCLATSIEAQAENFDILTNVITRKNIFCDGNELEKSLQNGNIVRVNYWDPRKNYGYKLDGQRFAKIAL